MRRFRCNGMRRMANATSKWDKDTFQPVDETQAYIFFQQVEIAETICLGLVALQHRGQESAGIVTSEGNCSKNFNVYKGMGMMNHIFNDEAIRKLKGNLGIGHTRYSTSASSEEVNCQPFVVHTAHGAMAVAHNGELVNCESLRRNVWNVALAYRHTAIPS